MRHLVDKGSEPVVLCSKMVRIASAFLKETDPEGYEMLCEGGKGQSDSIAFINEHLLKGELMTQSRLIGTFRPSSSGIGWRSRPDAVRSSVRAEESPRGWRIRVKKGDREKVTKVWDRFSASDMKHDIKVPSVARLRRKERKALQLFSRARNGAPGTRAEAPSGPERGGRFGGRFGFDPLVSVYGNHQHREQDRKDCGSIRKLKRLTANFITSSALRHS